MTAEHRAHPLRNPVAERADAFVRAIGLGWVGRLGDPKTREPRNLRWWPMALLALGAAGYAVIVVAGSPDRHHLVLPAIGYGSIYLAFATAGWLRMSGPRLIGTLDHPLDERERMIKARAGHIAGTVIIIAVFLGCNYFGLAGPFGLWMPNTQQWVALGILVMTWWLTLPVLIASWLQPRPDRD